MKNKTKVTTWSLKTIKDESYSFQDLVETENGNWVSIDDFNAVIAELKYKKEYLVSGYETILTEMQDRIKELEYTIACFKDELLTQENEK